MNKKIGLILAGIGIILLGTSLFISDGEKEKNEGKKDEAVTKFSYDYIKSLDEKDKTKVTFPIYEGMILDSNSLPEFNVSYDGKDNVFIHASIYTVADPLETFEIREYNDYKTLLGEQNRQVESFNIECSNLCKKYRVYNNDKTVYRDELRIYIKTSSEVAELIYRVENAELSTEKINNIIKNVKVTKDAVYKVGIIKGDNLIIKLDLRNNKTISFKLNKNKYEEIENGYNSKNRVTLKDKTTSTNFTIVTQFKHSDKTLINEIDKLHFGNNSSGTKEEIKIDNKTIYKYTIDDSVGYAYLIDDESALLVESNTSSINIEDIMKNIEE